MKAVLLVNMGSPSSEQEMKIFLRRMFQDKSIVKANFILRQMFSHLISTFRCKNSWKKYQKIGGSPLLKSMNKIKTSLEKSMSDNYTFHCAYSYSEPFIDAVMQKLYSKGVREFIVLPMYPHECFSTTGSISNFISGFKLKHTDCIIKSITNYYKIRDVITFWEELIQKHISEKNYTNPHLLFSAHAIPEYQIADGDTYTKHIAENAQLIAEKLNMAYSICYQSKIGRIKWIGPNIFNALTELNTQHTEQVIIVPISFLNENLETLYDLDIEIIPKAEKMEFKQISRIILPETNHLLIRTFCDLILNNT